MKNSVLPLLDQLETNLANIQSFLAETGIAHRDFERHVVWGPGHSKEPVSQLLFWQFRLQRLISYVKSCLAPGQPEPHYMLDLLRMVVRQTSFRLFTQQATATAVRSEVRDPGRYKADVSKLDRKQQRKFRDEYIAIRDVELAREQFRGSRAGQIAGELDAMGVTYCKRSTVARQLAKLHKDRKQLTQD